MGQLSKINAVNGKRIQLNKSNPRKHNKGGTVKMNKTTAQNDSTPEQQGFLHVKSTAQNKLLQRRQFEEALNHIDIMKNKSVVKIEDVNYLLDIGYRLIMEVDRITDSRAKWRFRAEEAEAKLK